MRDVTLACKAQIIVIIYTSHRFVMDGQNPDQSPYDNLDDAAATYAVGGMATHWTAATPREHPEVERSKLIKEDEWKKLYEESEELLKTSNELFNDSIRNTVVREKLFETYKKEFEEMGVQEQHYPQNLPLAGVRKSAEFITWTGSDTILGESLIKDVKSGHTKRFTLKVVTQAR